MPTPTVPSIVLASGSPRRRDLLAALGATFTVQPADVDETPRPSEPPRATAERLAAAKAAYVAARVQDALVLAADTIVTLDGETLGKPKDREENVRFLERLAGRTHQVVTAHTLRLGGTQAAATVVTNVTLRPLAPSDIERWVATGRGLDKAGGYAIQDHGAILVADVQGCYSNVIGLSVPTILRLAAELGVTLV